MRKLIFFGFGVACVFIATFTAKAEILQNIKDIRIAGEVHEYEYKVIKGWEIYKREDGSCFKRTSSFKGVTQVQTSVEGFIVNIPIVSVANRDIDCAQWEDKRSSKDE